MNRRFFSLFLIVFIDLIGLGIVMPVLLLHAQENLGATDLQATLLLTAYSLALLIAAPILGRLSDAFGRRPVLIVSQFGTMIGFLLLGFSNVLLLLFVGRIIDGISGGNLTTARAYINDITTEENRARGFGVISSAFGAGFVAGPALGGLVVGATANIEALAAYSQQAPFFLAALFSLGSIVATYFLLPESLPPEARSPLGQRAKMAGEGTLIDLIRPAGVRLVLFFSGVTFLAFSMMQASFALFARRNIFSPELPLATVQKNIGLMFALFGTLNVIMQAFAVGPLVKRFGERRMIAFGSVLRIGAFLGLALSRSPLAVALTFVPFAIGSSVSQPSVQSVLTRFAPPTMRGRLLGISQSTQSLVLTIGPIVAGLLLGAEFRSLPRHTANATPFFLAAGLMAIAFILSLQMLRMPLPSQEKVPTQAVAYAAD